MEVAIVPSINMYNSSTTSQLPMSGMYNPAEDDLQFHQHADSLNVPLSNQENLPPVSARKHGRSTSSVEPPHTIVKKKSRVGLQQQQQQQQQQQNSDHQHQVPPPMPDYTTTLNNTNLPINPSTTPLSEHNHHSGKNSPLDANFSAATPSSSPSMLEAKNLDEFVCVITPQGQVLYSTPTVQNLLGYHPSSMQQKTIMDFIHPQDRERFVQQADGTMANGNVLQVFYKLKTSSNVYKTFDIVGRPFYDASTNLSQLQVSLPGNTQQQNEATQAVSTSGKECRGLVLTLKTLDEVDNASKSNSLWARRQVSRLKKSPDMLQQQHQQFHHHGHVLERPASAASSISSNGGNSSAISINSTDPHSSLVPPPPQHFTPPAPLSIPSHHGLAGPSIHSAVPSPHSSTPHTSAYETSGIITTTVLDSVPQSATTISSSIPSSLPTSASYPTSAFSESYDDSSLLYPPHSAGLVDEPWLPHAPSPLSAQITHGAPKYAAFAANGRSYSYCEPNHTDGLGLMTSIHEDAPEFKSPHHRASYNHMVHPSHPHHPHHHAPPQQQSPNLPLQESPHTDNGLTPSSTPKALYSQQNNSTSELSQQTARVTLEDQDPLANAAYWDNSANSELVSPQYYQPPAVASLIGANGYLMDPQMRGKSYSLPNAFEVPAVSNARYQTYYPRAATGEIDFSGYTMSMKSNNPQMAQYHHHRKNYNLGPGPMAKPPRRKSSKAQLGMETPHVCAECGAMESPEWRKGPKGPKTLCNACGLRWAKKTRKEEGQVQNSAAVALRKKQ